MNLKDKLINNLNLGESKFIEQIENNKDLSYEKRNIENIEIVSVYDEREKDSKLIDEFEFDENENYVGNYEINMPKSKGFELYEQLSPEQKIHLADFEIINSINCATATKFTQREKEVLFEIIHETWLKDESGTSLSTIADKIVEAYGDGEVSLDALDNADVYDLLDCAIGMGSFEDLEDEWEDLEE